MPTLPSIHGAAVAATPLELDGVPVAVYTPVNGTVVVSLDLAEPLCPLELVVMGEPGMPALTLVLGKVRLSEFWTYMPYFTSPSPFCIASVSLVLQEPFQFRTQHVGEGAAGAEAVYVAFAVPFDMNDARSTSSAVERSVPMMTRAKIWKAVSGW